MKATALPPDAVLIPQAAKLIGLHPERVRQLIKNGHAASPARGYVGLAGLLRGYVTYLRSEAERPESDAAARTHAAKADLVAAATARRRTELMPCQDAEQCLSIILDTAILHLRRMIGKRALASLPPDVQATVKMEVAASLERISAAHDAAVEALLTGDFSALEGTRE